MPSPMVIAMIETSATTPAQPDDAPAARHLGASGITFGAPQIDLEGVRGFRDRTVGRLTNGLDGLARRRKVRVLTGTGTFTGPHQLSVAGSDGIITLRFENAIIASGSAPVRLAFLPDDPRIIDSTGAVCCSAHRCAGHWRDGRQGGHRGYH